MTSRGFRRVGSNPALDKARRRLKVSHWVALLLHGASCIALGILTDPDKIVPVYTSFPGARVDGDPDAWEPNYTRVGATKVGYLAVAFEALAFLNHAYSLANWHDTADHAAEGRNTARWIEYSVSASLMRVMIAQLTGIMDLFTLMIIYGLTAVTMFFGDAAEKTREWVYFWVGFVPHTVAWTPIFAYFFYSVRHHSVPGFVVAIVITVFVLDLSFAAVLAKKLNTRKNRADKQVSVETLYIFASLASKLALAWINFGGARQL